MDNTMDWWETTDWDNPEQCRAQRLAEGMEPGWSDRDEPAGDYAMRLDRLAAGDRPAIGGAS